MHARVSTLAAVLIAVAALPAAAQNMIESSNLNSTSATVERPEWAKQNGQTPASRFLGGTNAGLGSGAWFQAQGIVPGSFTSIGSRSGGPLAPMPSGRTSEPALLVRPRSNAPGRLAGLVYESGTRRPVPGVLVRLVSTDPAFQVEKLDARTDSAGYYEFPRVDPGPWRLGLVADAVPPAFVPLRVSRAIAMAKKDSVAADPFVLRRAACVHGHAGWSDGYVLFDAPLTVAPLDTTLGATSALMNGIGDFRACGAPEDSVMVWMHLRDGRSLGHTARLAAGDDALVGFTPDPLEKMPGCTLRVLPVLNDGSKVERAAITVVGRRFEQGATPALVYVRDEQADADGIAEFRVPFGVYELLVTNPRTGETGRVSHMVVNTDQPGAQALRVELRDPVSVAERARMRADLLDRAETYLYVWSQ